MNELTDTKAISGLLSYEQRELVDLISTEVSELLVDQVKLNANHDNAIEKQEYLKEAIEKEIENSRRIGTAAQMIGLHGLYDFCQCISENFQLINKNDSNLFNALKSKLITWPKTVQAYLNSPSDTKQIKAILEFLKHDDLPLKLSEDKIRDIENRFIESNVEIDTISDQVYLATSDLVSLEVSEDVDSELLNSVVQDLPLQTQELSDSVAHIQDNDFKKYLELSERIAHTIKGASSTAGLTGIVNLTHHLESIFSSLSRSKTKPNEKLYTLIQSTTDCLEEMSEYLQGTSVFPKQSVSVLQDLLNWSNNKSSKIPGVILDAPSLKTTSDNSNFNQGKTRENAQEISVEPKLQVSMHLVDRLLKNAGENIISNEQIHEFSQQLKTLIKNIILNNKQVKNLAQEIENRLAIQKFSPNLSAFRNESKFDSLEIEQFNELHTLSNQLLESADDSVEFSSQAQDKIFKLEKIAVNQVRSLHDNQESVLRIRMVPVNNIVPRLKRSVRQACKLTGKSAQLEIVGAETLIDSGYINQLIHPIMHILRNAIDHGIECPEIRAKSGKDVEGKIKLSFNKTGNLIKVSCQDDGAGLDLIKIKSKSIEKRLLNKSENLSKQHAFELIQRHGFSTKDKVTHLSGRGVGLADALTKINEMKGSITFDSKQGSGLRVDIVLPMTFNAIHALIVRSKEDTYAISNRGIDEILFSGAGKSIKKNGKYFYQYSQKKYPLYDLNYLLLKTEQNEPAENNICLIVNDDTNKKHVISIDEIFDTRDIVAKPLSKYIPKIAGIHGTTILGDGSVTAVIDMVELLQNAKSSTYATRVFDKSGSDTSITRNALIVEDAISTRKLLAQFMQDLGFTVFTAKDGVEAIRSLQQQLPSVVLTDLEMPRMNGLELTDHLRSNTDTSAIPIILITSKFSEKHKIEAKRLGVSAYITKPFDEDELLALITALKLLEN